MSSRFEKLKLYSHYERLKLYEGNRHPLEQQLDKTIMVQARY